MKNRWVFGVEARDGMIFCTVMAGDGTVRAMRVFPQGGRGVKQLVRFTERQGVVEDAPVIGLMDRTSRPGTSADLAEAFRREGFRVCPLPGGDTTKGLALDGGRNSRRAARAMLKPAPHDGKTDE